MQKLILICVMVLFSSIIADRSVYALPAFYKMFKAKYNWRSGCNVCHFSKKGGDAPNPYGRAFLHNGMNLSTFTRIEKTDSDKDGFSNIAELIARSYPGDAASTPENVESSIEQSESDEEFIFEDDDVFSFDGVDAAEDSSESQFLSGAFSNLIFGGALDIRRITRGQDLIPDRDNWDSGTTLIHVAEFVVTTSVGDHVSILGEQLLTTSPLGTEVADDHGFVYAILTGIPVLPKGASLKIGRFRHGFGIDTKSDAAANPLYNLVRKNIGFISDRGLQLNGFVGPISYVVSLADGPDSLRTVTDGTVTSGIRIGPHGSGGILKPIRNSSPPVFVHLNGTLPVFGKRFWLGASYFDGNSYPFNPINGDVNPSTLVYKRRLGLAISFKVWKFDLAAEWVRGRDTILLDYFSRPIQPENRNATVEGFYFHVELPLNESLDIRLKYDVWNPDRDLFSTFSLDREPEESTWSTLGGALTWHFSEGALARIVYQVNNVEKSTRSAAIVPQLLVEF